jgi:hypothetical protein
MISRLLPGDRVLFVSPTSGRRLRAVVVDYLPMGTRHLDRRDELVPVCRCKAVLWLARKQLRKLPSPFLHTSVGGEEGECSSVAPSSFSKA